MTALDDLVGSTPPEPRLLPADEDRDIVWTLRRRIVLLEDGLAQKDRLIADAVLALHEAGDHESADRIERDGAPF